MNKRVACVLVASLLIWGRAHAGAVVGATEPTQIMNNLQLLASYAEQAQQTATQMQQYQAMLRNLQAMTPSARLNDAAFQLFRDQGMGGVFQNLGRIVVAGQSTSFTLANMDSRFRQVYPGASGYGRGFNFQQAYSGWSTNTLDSVRNALSSVSIQARSMATEEDMMRELEAKSLTAQGQLESLQAGQQISLAMVGQMQKLRQLQMTQMEAQNHYIAGQQSKADADDAVMRQFLNRDQKRVRTYQEISSTKR